MEIFIKVIMLMVNLMDLDNITGAITLFIKDNLLKDLDKDKEHGLAKVVISILVILVEIVKTG